MTTRRRLESTHPPPPLLAHDCKITTLPKVPPLASRSFSIFVRVFSALAHSGNKPHRLQVGAGLPTINHHASPALESLEASAALTLDQAVCRQAAAAASSRSRDALDTVTV